MSNQICLKLEIYPFPQQLFELLELAGPPSGHELVQLHLLSYPIYPILDNVIFTYQHKKGCRES